jgi:hypothetical protein
MRVRGGSRVSAFNGMRKDIVFLPSLNAVFRSGTYISEHILRAGRREFHPKRKLCCVPKVRHLVTCSSV